MAFTPARTPAIRLGYAIAERTIEQEIGGRVLGEQDYSILLNPAGGPMLVRMNNGQPLCCYLPGVLKDIMKDVDAYRLLHPLHTMMTNNRGMASGSRRIERGEPGAGNRSDAMLVSSPFLGSVDPSGVYRYCRTTEWTGSHLPEFTALAPMFRVIARYFEEWIPERYNAQMEYVRRTDDAWVVPGTPFTTITVNNSFPTGVHKDAGDLESGFSTLACIRRGEYEGGVLVFPQYRVAADMQDGDLILMDAHQWHGNTRMTCACGERIQNKFCTYCGAERISIVSYYRTRMAECGSPEEEYERALASTEKRSRPRGEPAPEPESVTTTAEPATSPDEAASVKPARKPRVSRKKKTEPVPAPAADPEPIPVAAEEPAKPRRRSRRTAADAAPARSRMKINPETGEPLA